jgi:signal transduction histidine kinase/CheY-like chemotaxis protein
MKKLSFKNISFKYKIISVILLVTFFTQFLGVFIYIIFDKNQFQLNTEQELKMISNIIANNSIAPLLFNDKNEASFVLQSLKAHPNIKTGYIYDENKNFFADYSVHKNLKYVPSFIPFSKDTILYSDTTFTLIKRIIDETEHAKTIGYLYIVRDLNDYNQRLLNVISANIIIALILLFFAFIIATQLQKIISLPILRLSAIVRKISLNRDFSLRINKRGNDEVGHLIDGFNSLLNTIEKQNKELVSAKDEAIQSAQIKQQFLANMSHEIRTPMNAIVGITNLLLNTELDKEQKEYLHHIDLSSNNLLVILNDILDFAKIESGKVNFENARFNLNDTLDNISKMFEAKIKEKNLSFTIEKGPDIPAFLIGDQVRLSQILTNLVGNSVKFTLEGNISIQVQKKKELPSNFFEILFIVSDTGIGIATDRKSYIFESFTQASNDTTRKFGGTGLGLTISKQLVELQNGKIWFDSEENKGTTFYFYIPFEKANPPSLEELQLKSNIGANYFQKSILEDTIILIAEDNALNLFLTKTLLTKQRFSHIMTAGNGQEVIDILKNNDIDIILMDLHMPVMDGFEATRFIRNNFSGKKQKLPIIALTAAAIASEQEKCLEAGMSDYLPKPFKPNELFEKILFYLNQKK